MASKLKWLGTAIGLLMAIGLIGVLFVARPWAGDDSPHFDTATRDAPRGEFPAVTVELTSVERSAVSATLELTGHLLPRRRTIVVAEVDGVIQSIPRSPRKIDVAIEGRKYSENLGLDLGQPVAQGDILIQLDPTEYQLELASAKSKLHKSQKDLDNLLAWKRPEQIRRLQAARQDAVARAERAEADFKRVESLIGQRATSEQEYLRIQSEFRSALAAVERADADLAEAEAGPTEAEIAVLRALVSQAEVDVQIKEDRLQKTVIRSPYDAVIVDRFVDEGERLTAQPRVELMELMDLSLVIAQVAVPERYLGRVEIGQFVKVQAAGTVEAVPGVIVLVNEKVDHATRTFRVRVAVENDKRTFKAGQFAKVAFEVDTATQALIVPTPALVYFGGQPQVFVYDSDSQRVAQRPVRVGLTGNGVTEVIDGLTEGERIVLQDPAILADGMRVQPAAAQRNAAVEDENHALSAASEGGSRR
jgi:multidrug efflux pump subunit AcrA (membrane-fusion protein)